MTQVLGRGGLTWAYLKEYCEPRKYQQERLALKCAASKLVGHVPRILGHCDPSHRLLLEALPGESVETIDRPRETMFARAGQIVRELHSLPISRDPVPLDRALELRLSAQLKRQPELFNSNQLAVIERAREELSRFHAEPRRFCHRDYQPRNWIWDSGRKEIRIIDFEHAQPDVRYADLIRLWLPQEGIDDAERRAFFEGYGEPEFLDGESPALRSYAVVWCVTTAVWAREHRQPEFEVQAATWLSQL